MPCPTEPDPVTPAPEDPKEVLLGRGLVLILMGVACVLSFLVGIHL